ncbi:hypothetical protein AHAS_Ahas01G0318600 [Arachis hypogaea]
MDVDQYAHYRRFLDKRNLALQAFWLWIVDVQKKAFYVLDLVNKKKDEIPYLKIKLNKFVNMNIVWFIVVAELHSFHPYVFTWVLLHTQNEEIDAFLLEYGPNIMLHKQNKIRDQVIQTSKEIRLPKPSATLSSPYCKFTSGDIDSK